MYDDYGLNYVSNMAVNVIIPIDEIVCQTCDKPVEYVVFEDDFDANETPNGYCKEHAIVALRNDVEKWLGKFDHFSAKDREYLVNKSKLTDDELLIEQRAIGDYL